MKSFLLFVIAMFAVFQTAYSIKCYLCSGKEDDCTKEKLKSNQDKYLTDCVTQISKLDRCMRMSTKKGDVRGVYMNCATKVTCDSTHQTCKKISSEDGSCKVGCCNTDACNAGVIVFTSALLLSVCVFIGLRL